MGRCVRAAARGARGLLPERFRAEFKPAFDAWIATKPLKTEGAPLTPFAMAEYRLAARRKPNGSTPRPSGCRAEARLYIQRASNYVLCVVLFAVALFFAGISTKLTAPRLRATMLGIGVALFLGAVVWIATFPVSVAV